MTSRICTAALVFSVLASTFASAANRIEVGLGSGTTQAYSGDTFKNQSSSGNAESYWIGYGLDKNLSLELGLDFLDFDKINTQHQAINLLAVYRFNTDTWIHPIAKIGAGVVQSKLVNDDKTSSFGIKAAGGLEADCKYISFGGLVNYNYIAKAGDADVFKNIQAIVPMVFISFHNAVEYEAKSVSEAPPAAVAAPVALAKKDSDKDGIADEEDKCPNTGTGVVVNKFGCAEMEKASIRLNIEFLVGKATFDPSFNSEIQSLAEFMRKFPETKVEIGGYTDNQGSPARNKALSQKRADSVKTALVKAGVEPERIKAVGYGQEKAVADNKKPEGRKLNRRVMAEISVTTEKKK